MHLTARHNLTAEELHKAVVSLTEAHGLSDAVIESLLKACSCDDSPKEPRQPAIRELYRRFRAEFFKATNWIQEYVTQSLWNAYELKKSEELRRPLTKEEIQEIQQAIRDRFSFIAGQMESDFAPSEDLLRRWKELGFIHTDITPSTFAIQVSTEGQLIKNAFVFGRLHLALEQGKTYEEVFKLALEMPLLKPDKYAIAVAEQQTANYITAMGDDLAKVAGQLAAKRNQEIIRNMAIKFHKQELTAVSAEGEATSKLVDSWQGFASELYHAMDDKARDWERIAFYEINDAKAQGQALSLLEKYGKEQLVYKVPMPTACPQCKELYLQDDMQTPRLFKLGQMLSWGQNIGRKPMPVRNGRVVSRVREDGEETLKPVAGQVHPFCQCHGPTSYTGYEWFADYYTKRSKNVSKP